MPTARASARLAVNGSRPRIGCLGTGWIGRARLGALVASQLVEVAAVADVDERARADAAADSGAPHVLTDLDGLLDLELDGIVIATPSALHADQSLRALRSGLAVFCQKPLGRDQREVAHVVETAREADRLLAVDLSYRHTRALAAARQLVRSGQLGRVFAAELTFHNAYGPDKPWFQQRGLSGGGALIDLGTHLLDLALWLTDPKCWRVEWARTLRRGRRLAPDAAEVEDFAVAEVDLDGSTVVRIACSWWLAAGRDCVFECTLHGTLGAVSVTNVAGSFYDLRVDHHRGTATELLVAPPDDWSGRAITDWARRLAQSSRFDPAADELVHVAALIDQIYRWQP